MWSDWLLLVVGLALLIFGAQVLVQGAANLALRLNVTPLVVGLTVVAFGTSSPELAVSVRSALEGQAALSLGNVVGSNIFNVLVVLGASALITPLAVEARLVRFDVPLMIGVSVAVLLLALDGSLSRAHGVGRPDGFDLDDHSLRRVAIATWRRLVFVHVADPGAELDLGPLARAVDACPVEDMTLVRSETDERAFNWKVLLENYSENYHTPFVHPEIDTTPTEDYPMVSDGPVLYAWDRPRRPGSPTPMCR